MSELILALDQGTSSSKCLVVDRELSVRGSAVQPVSRSFPRPGWVEQDPDELVTSVIEAAANALRESGSAWRDIAGVAIANQTETFVVWERGSGRPVHPAIVWQCRRGGTEAAALERAGHADEVRRRTGLELDPTFPAPKLRWLLDNVAGTRERAERGELLYGDVASWLIWRLSGGATHIADASNVSRSMLADLGSLEWDVWLLELFGIPPAMLPAPSPCAGWLADTSVDVLGAEVPVVAALGDQQASLFGLRCWAAGQTKVTLGTGAFLWENVGAEPAPAGHGLVASCAWAMPASRAYALEGFVSDAGAAVEWLVDVGLLGDVAESEALAASLDEGAPDIVCVPALSGLASPHWDPQARATLLGVSRATSREHLAAAVLDGVAHELADAVEAMAAQLGRPPEVLRVDGGMSANSWLLQRLADLSAVPIERSGLPGATALGAAMLGATMLEDGPSLSDLAAGWEPDRVFEPQMDDARRDEARARWRRAVELARSWRV